MLYLAIDLANPFVSGAFGFTPEKGLVWIEVIPHARRTLSVGTSEARDSTPWPRFLPVEGECPRVTEPGGVKDLAAWLIGVRTLDPPARDLPPPSTDDH